MTPTRPAGRRLRRSTLALGLSGVAGLALVAPVGASSHREAPMIAQDPVADNTDTYAWVPAPGQVAIAANFHPAEDPAAGPNYFRFGDDVLYELKIDNDGDAVEDITYEFRFETDIQNPDDVIAYQGVITSLDDPDYNLRQLVTAYKVEDGERTRILNRQIVPPNNVGPRSTPNYDSLANSAIYTGAGGERIFTGQREDPFYGDIGAAFDALNLRSAAVGPDVAGDTTGGVDFFEGYNVHSIVLQVPAADLTTGPGEPTIGVWSTTNRSKIRVFYQNQSFAPTSRGEYVQTSRLGNPLVNEVVIPLGLKDVFNNLPPAADAAALSQEEDADGITIPVVQDPLLAQALQANGIPTPDARGDDAGDEDGPRNDLVSVFLTGLEGLNDQLADNPGAVPAEYLRLNTSINPTANPNRLGAAAGDNAGFPNGRRPVDDVVDIALSAVRGFLLDPEQYPAIGDGVPFNDREFLDTFPYLATPFEGFGENNETRGTQPETTP